MSLKGHIQTSGINADADKIGTSATGTANLDIADGKLPEIIAKKPALANAAEENGRKGKLAELSQMPADTAMTSS